MNFKISNILSFSKALINKGHDRSVKTKKNILALFMVKGGSIFINLLLVPLTINYINPTRYGIWITLSSIIGWFSFFDIGFGNGLRNKFTENVAKGDHETARIYVSTTYFVLCILVIIVLALFLIINPYLSWDKILNTPASMGDELSLLALILFVFFCVQFVLQLLNTVMTANQEPAKASILQLIGNAFALLLIFIITKTTSSNLIYLGAIVSISPVIVLAISSIWFYKHEYKLYAPAIRYVKLSYAKNLMSLGLKFFVIQIAAVIFFQTDNIVITQLFGPKEVTVFNIAFKLFSIIVMIFSIVVTPLWSAFSDAYTKGDFEWITLTLSKVKKIWYLIILVTIATLFASPLIFKYWVGDTLKVPIALSIAMSTYVIATTWQSIHIYFLNGIGKIQVQLYLVIISGIVNIPLAIFLGKKIGLIGVSLSNTLLFILMGIVFSIQTKKIRENKANGIWNK